MRVLPSPSAPPPRGHSSITTTDPASQLHRLMSAPLSGGKALPPRAAISWIATVTSSVATAPATAKIRAAATRSITRQTNAHPQSRPTAGCQTSRPK